VQLIWRCEQKEFEMNTKRALKSCHYVGSYCNTNVLGACLEKRQSYCCFNSPLSRILQEQARPQLHMSWGTANAPQCQGFTPAQVNQINWQQIDFSEWIALLALGGQLPNLADINLDQLTGQGSSFNTNGLRQNASERTQKRLNGIDVEALNYQSAVQLGGSGK
jgi:conjugal transfer mating pair stabilization protein TraN